MIGQKGEYTKLKRESWNAPALTKARLSQTPPVDLTQASSISLKRAPSRSSEPINAQVRSHLSLSEPIHNLLFLLSLLVCVTNSTIWD